MILIPLEGGFSSVNGLSFDLNPIGVTNLQILRAFPVAQILPCIAFFIFMADSPGREIIVMSVFSAVTFITGESVLGYVFLFCDALFCEDRVLGYGFLLCGAFFCGGGILGYGFLLCGAFFCGGGILGYDFFSAVSFFAGGHSLNGVCFLPGVFFPG